MVAANSRFLKHCEKRDLMPEGIFAEIIELKYGLCTFNVYYSNEQDEIDLAPELVQAMLQSNAITSMYRLRHLVVAEHMIDGDLHRQLHKERTDLVSLTNNEASIPAYDRSQFIFRSRIYDREELLVMKQQAARATVLDTVKTLFRW